ncbi:MAG: DinB family protein [Bacteroidetes bacterium QH_7_62_13]|nr:MAG: DinB family protein [Bacteroidetes bacterium QH_7_62_13]
MSTPPSLREHVVNLLTVRQAHGTFEDAVAQMRVDRVGDRPDGMPYSVWELVEHLRRAQRDILEYCRDPNYEAREWPDSYWPDTAGPPTPEAWNEAVSGVQDDHDALCAMVRDERLDLYDTVPSSDEHTYLREMLLVADHNAYHIGQIVTVRRQLGLWPTGDDVE